MSMNKINVLLETKLLTLLFDEMNFYLCGESSEFYSNYKNFIKQINDINQVCSVKNINPVELMLYIAHYRLYQIKKKQINDPQPLHFNFDRKALYHYSSLYINYIKKHKTRRYQDFNDINIRFILNLYNQTYTNIDNKSIEQEIKKSALLIGLTSKDLKVDINSINNIIYSIGVIGLENVNTNFLFTTDVLDNINEQVFNNLSVKKHLPNNYYMVYNSIKGIYKEAYDG